MGRTSAPEIDGSSDLSAVVELAQDPASPADALGELASAVCKRRTALPADDMAAMLAANPSTPAVALITLGKFRHHPEVHSRLVTHPNATVATLSYVVDSSLDFYLLRQNGNMAALCAFAHRGALLGVEDVEAFLGERLWSRLFAERAVMIDWTRSRSSYMAFTGWTLEERVGELIEDPFTDPRAEVVERFTSYHVSPCYAADGCVGDACPGSEFDYLEAVGIPWDMVADWLLVHPPTKGPICDGQLPLPGMDFALA